MAIVFVSCSSNSILPGSVQDSPVTLGIPEVGRGKGALISYRSMNPLRRSKCLRAIWSPGKPSYNGKEDSNVPRQFDVVIERDSEGYYVASVPQIPACHTQARSLDEVTERIREAIALCLEIEGAPEQDLEFVGIQRVTIAA